MAVQTNVITGIARHVDGRCDIADGILMFMQAFFLFFLFCRGGPGQQDQNGGGQETQDAFCHLVHSGLLGR